MPSMTIIEFKRLQRERKRKRKKKLALTVIVIIFIVIAVLLLCGMNHKKEPTYEYHTCNTLWEFLRFCPKSMDRWEYLEEIMILNDMPDETVYPNRLYQVPIYNQ